MRSVMGKGMKVGSEGVLSGFFVLLASGLDFVLGRKEKEVGRCTVARPDSRADDEEDKTGCKCRSSEVFDKLRWSRFSFLPS